MEGVTTVKRWLGRGLTLGAVLVVTLVAFVASRAETTQRPVGLTVLHAEDARGRSFPIVVWYPTTARPWPTTPLGLVLMQVARDGPVDGAHLPLVVISHGNRGGPGSHADLALALANAGSVVAAPLHLGDEVEDGSGVGTVGFWSGRNQQLRATIDALTTQWSAREQLDPTRIAAFGFSAGGFTVLTAIGARPQLSRIAPHCAETPEFACEVLKEAGSPLLHTVTAADEDFGVDARIKAAVVVAPGLGFTFPEDGFTNVRVPVQLWAGGRDTSVPEASNTARVSAGLGARVEYHLENGAGHLSFLTPCSLLQPAPWCRDESGFDRRGFHQRMNAEVRRFLDGALGR